MSLSRNVYDTSKRTLSAVPHKLAYQAPGWTCINYFGQEENEEKEYGHNSIFICPHSKICNQK